MIVRADRLTLRSWLPGPVDAVAGIAAAVAGRLAELHGRGETHGAIGLDTILIGHGSVDLIGATGEGTPLDDIAALGRLVSAALTGSTDPRAGALAAVAAVARRAVISGTPDASSLVAAFAEAVPGARLARDDEPGAEPRQSPATLFALLALFAVAAIALVAAGSALPPPPVLGGLGALGPWAAQLGGAGAFFALVRLVALVLALYLFASTAIAAVIHVLSHTGGPARRIADALLLPPVRRVVHGAVGATIATGALMGATGAGASTPPPLMRRVDRAPDVVMTALPTAPAAGVTMRRVEAVPAPDPTPNPHQPTEWEVQPGDHLWSIAFRVLQASWERDPSDAEVDPYWRTLVDANRDRLADPGNADLIFPGQHLTVPAPTAVPPR